MSELPLNLHSCIYYLNYCLFMWRAISEFEILAESSNTFSNFPLQLLISKVLVCFLNPAPFSPNVGCISKRAWLKLILSYRTSQHVKFIANDSYPYNIMRNVARDGAVTEFVLMSDIDHVPNEGIFDTLEDFLAQDKVYYARKLAYVIPQYELNLTKVVQIPSDKAELLELEKKKLAAPMYQDYFPQFQHCVKPKLWESINETHVDQYLAMQVNFTFSCEMTLVHKARDPYFDERFRGYGFDRFSQVRPCPIELLAVVCLFS